MQFTADRLKDGGDSNPCRLLGQSRSASEVMSRLLKPDRPEKVEFMATLHPLREEFDRFATPLSKGELQVIDRLEDNLDERWHVFVQPKIQNQQPSALLMAQHHGVTVVLVKDWVDGGYRNRDGRLEIRDDSGQWHSTEEDPIAQAHRYRSVVSDLLTRPSEGPLFSRVRAAVVLPQWSTESADTMLRKVTDLKKKDADYIPVLGQEVFGDRGWLKRLVYGGDKKSAGLASRTFERLHSRLAEHEALAEQRQPLRLSAGARNVESNPSGAVIRRVRGSAGSGKTLGIAARAGQLAAEGKRVLVLSFNITLAHYIQDLVRRHAQYLGADHRLVDCMHMHGFASAVVRGRTRLVINVPSQELDPDWVIAAAQELYGKGFGAKYDAVLVDEGQDFNREWWDFLRDHVRQSPQSEMILAADATQDIYSKQSWTDEEVMQGSGFSGPWTRLDGCYRLPADLIPIVSEFATTFIGDEADLPGVPSDHTGLAAAPTVRRWLNAGAVTPEDAAPMVAEAVLDLVRADLGIHPADVVYLANNHKAGLEVATTLEQQGLEVEHIFATTRSRRDEAKRRFWPGVPYTKGCTVHSFKGWEARAVVILTDDLVDTGPELTYVGLSRVKGDLRNRSAYVTVVNTVPRLDGFKERFEREVGPDEVAALAGQTQLDLG